MINPADIQLDKLPSVALANKCQFSEMPVVHLAIDSYVCR